MRILSATEAISPAIARTRLILFRPFRLGRSWKFAAAGYASTMGSVYFPVPLLALFFLPALRHVDPPWLTWALGPGLALLLGLITFLFMICSRLQFPVQDIVINRSVKVAPLWRQYGPRSRPWTRAKLYIGTVAMFMVATPGAILGWIAYKQSNSAATPGHAVAPLAGWFFVCVCFIYFGFALLTLAMSLLNDFMLPPQALEDASVSDAWQWVQKLVRGEPGQVALYGLLKVVLGMIAQMACGIIMEIFIVIVVLLLFGLGLLIGLLFHAAHVPDGVLQILGFAGLGVIYIAVIVYFAPFANGITMIFLEAYKLYFLGGRYPPLGDALDRSTLPPEPPPPAPQFGYVPITPNTLL